MKSQIFKYLNQNCGSDPSNVDRLIISTFIFKHGINVLKNTLIKNYIINKNDNDYNTFIGFVNECEKEEVDFTLEDLIELFEFVISPADKIINGAVYTPRHIRNYIVEQSLAEKINDRQIICGDIACGCGGFLLTLAEKLNLYQGKSYYQIYKDNLYGLDIAEYSIERTKILLTLKALLEGEDKDFIFNLSQGNALDFDWKSAFPEIEKNSGFDIIVGNPPYVCSRNMDDESLQLLDKWEVTRSGHPDLYIPFFQIGLENLNQNGILGYITVNTFFKSVNGRALREYFAKSNIKLLIINFGSEQVFKDKSTYTCICLLKKAEVGRILYIKSTSKDIRSIRTTDFYEYEYSKLNNFDGWNLVSSKNEETFINIIENTGIPFKDKFTTRNGIATLKNNVYKFFPLSEDDEFFYIESDDKEYMIEKLICREIINSNKISNTEDIRLRKEQIIFPYNMIEGKPQIMMPSELKTNYPRAYNYLLSKKNELSTRDKGNREYEKWYAYGRNQSLDIHSYKLFFPHICERPKFILCRDKDLLFYNGIAVISNDLGELKILKKILESNIFYEYIKHTSKDYSSGYISLSRNYIKNFGICELTKEEKTYLLELTDTNEIEEFLLNKYAHLPSEVSML